MAVHVHICELVSQQVCKNLHFTFLPVSKIMGIFEFFDQKSRTFFGTIHFSKFQIFFKLLHNYFFALWERFLWKVSGGGEVEVQLWWRYLQNGSTIWDCHLKKKNTTNVNSAYHRSWAHKYTSISVQWDRGTSSRRGEERWCPRKRHQGLKQKQKKHCGSKIRAAAIISKTCLFKKPCTFIPEVLSLVHQRGVWRQLGVKLGRRLVRHYPNGYAGHCRGAF